MPTNKRLAVYLATGAAVSAIAVTAGIIASSSSDAAKPTATSSVITTRTISSGKILTDGRGRTVYLFAQDIGSAPTCSGTCAGYWPPVPAAPGEQAGGGAAAADLSSVAAPDGARQLTYAGHPLYYFVGDRKPGDTNGQGLDQFGAKWYALDPAGAAVTKSISAARSNGGGGGYGY